jgi:hypothetical protein
VLVLEQQAGLLEHALLAGGVARRPGRGSAGRMAASRFMADRPGSRSPTRPPRPLSRVGTTSIIGTRPDIPGKAPGTPADGRERSARSAGVEACAAWPTRGGDPAPGPCGGHTWRSSLSMSWSMAA